jgi:siroheme synthase
MSVGRLGQLTSELMSGGFPSRTPVAVVQSGSRQTQATLRSTVADVAAAAEAAGVRAPAVVVVGDTVTCLDGVALAQYPELVV